MNDTLTRLAFVADVHHGPDEYGKLGSRALEELEAALAGIARTEPDAVIDLGDRITDESPEADLRRTAEVGAAWRRTTRPRHHLVGNHDVDVPRADAEHALDATLASHVTSYGDVRLVVWNASVTYPGLTLADEDLRWLGAALAASDDPTVVVSHVPFGGASLVGNAYFETRTEGRGRYVNEALARELVLEHPNVLACLSGHVHANTIHVVDGVAFLTLHGLSERATTAPEPSGAWATLDITEASLAWDVRGRQPWRLEMPRRQPGRRWIRPSRGDAWPA